MKNEAKVLQKTAKVVPEIKVENSLFDELRALRKEIATNEKIPPYMVFSDATLQEEIYWNNGANTMKKVIKKIIQEKINALEVKDEKN